MHSPERSASTAAANDLAASAVPRSTGIWCAPSITHFSGGVRHSSFFARNRGGRCRSQRYSPTVSGSSSLTWLATTMMPPLEGTFSWPRWSRMVNRRSSGFTTTTTRRYQNPTRTRCATFARMPDVSPAAQSWAAVVPVKRLPLAKTRIALPADLRAELALAIAADTVAACRATSAVARIVVVTDDEDAAARLAELGAVVVPDAPDAGLNPALRH